MFTLIIFLLLKRLLLKKNLFNLGLNRSLLYYLNHPRAY